MGVGTLEANHEILKRLSGISNPDTVINIRIKLNETTSFNFRLFELLLNNADNALKDPRKFRYAIKGLALVPENPSGSIIGFTGSSLSRSRLTLHYHTPADTLARVFYFDAGSFNNITTNRIGDLAGLNFYEPIQPASDKRYVQNGSPAVTRIHLSDFHTAMDTIPKAIFNSAELVIQTIEPPVLLNPPTLFLRTLKDDNQFFNNRIAADRQLWQHSLCSRTKITF